MFLSLNFNKKKQLLIFFLSLFFILSFFEGEDETSHECYWKFLRYESSAFEIEWIATVKDDYEGEAVCEGSPSPNTIDITLENLRIMEGHLVNSSRVKLYSKLYYKLHCPVGKKSKFGSNVIGAHLIEPLSVNLRDPCDRFCYGSKCGDYLAENSGQSKKHMLPLTMAPFSIQIDGAEERWYSGLIAPWYCHTFVVGCNEGNGILFDLGASYFNSWGLDGGNANAGGWLFQQYFYNGVKIQDYYAFEYESLDPIKVFDQIPASIMDSYHWINVPVSSEEGSKTNPWTILQNRNNTGITVVKLDIDTPTIESALVDQLLEMDSPSLIDEFYYEHHVSNRRMNPSWSIQSGTIPNLNHSYQLFLRLREKGIRSHSWP